MLLLTTLAATAAAAMQLPPSMHATFIERAAPSGDYAPSRIACPALPASNSSAQYVGQIRNATNFQLNPQEAAYISAHRNAKKQDWATWLSSSKVGLDSSLPGGASNYTSDVNRLPRVAIASSGGGFRAMLNAAGIFSALDSRNASAVSAGTGGVLQLSDYIVGLSGGSWLTGSVAMNDYATTQSLHDQLWNLDSNLIVPEEDKLTFYISIIADVAAKRGFTGNEYTGITDYWGRALAWHLINNTLYPEHGAKATWSDIRSVSNFASAAYPFPIVISDQRDPGTLQIQPDSPIWEFTPYEFGTWNTNISAFIDVDLMGSRLVNGVPNPNDNCTGGYDNAGWVMGCSSTLFNAGLTTVLETSGESVIKSAIENVLSAIGRQYNDVALVPNSFYGYRNETNELAQSPNITLVDGGEDGQNIPLWPVLNPGREVDFVLAIDSSADETDWPNGTSLVATSLRAQSPNFAQYAFPEIPSQNTFVNRGLNTRPTFFGCPGANITNARTTATNESPLIAYLPSFPYAGLANVSTFQLEYMNNMSQLVMDNAFAVATLGGASVVAGDNLAWPKCLACGMLMRSFQRSGTAFPSDCQVCYDTFCWDGIRDDSTPVNPYSPPVGTPEFVSSKGSVQKTPDFTGGNGRSASDPNAASSSDGGGSKNTNAAAASAAMGHGMLAWSVLLFFALALGFQF